ncbi:hypothetical protein ACP3W2_27165, partial [Salmonella enterica]|uniref:hypothetical protein n=1 Tax=Salmonella enterica TaxID=28901 RepID=UPI003CF57138
AAEYRTKLRKTEKDAEDLKMKDASTEEKLAAAQKRAEEAEARAVRREVALDHGLSKDDASFLDGLLDEDQMRKLAKRLS